MAAAAAPKQKIPLGIKLKAWWEGYDADALAALLAQNAPAKPAAPKAPPAPARTEPDLITPTTAFEKPFDAWSTDRVSIAQLIWGEGYCGPGGPEHVIAMSKLLALSPEMSMVHIGAGLGGPARILSQEFGVWVTGYEESQALVDRGNELSTMAGLSRKAEMAMLDMSNPAPFGRKFDRAMTSNFFVYHNAKEEIVHKISDALKPEGLLLITDLFVADDAPTTTPEFQTWRSGEPRRPTPGEVRDLIQLLESADFTVRVNDDLSAEHVSLVTQAWSNANKVIADVMASPETAPLAPLILKEVEVWTRRMSMIKAGNLTYRRLLAAKKDKSLR